MTLDELKALWDAALEKLKAAPEDAALKAEADKAQAAYDEAKAEDDAKKAKGTGEGGDLDESKWDDKTKAYIQKLRGESAGHRTKNKDLASKLKVSEEQKKAILKAAGIESEDEKPEEKVKSLTTGNQQLAFRNAILESAVHNGISGDDVDYYEFLITRATEELEEGDELADEVLEAIVGKVKAKSKGAANTSVGNGGKGGAGGAPKPGESGSVSLDAFVRMSIAEKSELYTKNPELYKALVAEAKSKKKLV